MNIKILDAIPENAIDIYTINSLTWLHTYKSDKYGINEKLLNKYPTSEEKKLAFISRKSKEILDNPGSYVVLINNNKVVGYACGKKYGDKKYNEFFAIYILPEYHKRGLGKLLAEKTFNYLGSEKPIIVQVVGYNKNAISFYEKLGFILDKKLNDFEIINGIWVPEILMIKK